LVQEKPSVQLSFSGEIEDDDDDLEDLFGSSIEIYEPVHRTINKFSSDVNF
jgi:hypothetical protein